MASILKCSLIDVSQAFKKRLTEVIDQAQHFAALGSSGAGGSTGDSAQSFREGLDGTEREREHLARIHGLDLLT